VDRGARRGHSQPHRSVAAVSVARVLRASALRLANASFRCSNSPADQFTFWTQVNDSSLASGTVGLNCVSQGGALFTNVTWASRAGLRSLAR
jgi:hypothetical protein